MHYSAYGKYIIKEHYDFNNLKNNSTSFGLSDAEKQAMKDESNKRGTSVVNQSSDSSKEGGKMITKEKEEVIDVKTTSEAESDYVDKIDITKIKETNQVIKSQTKKMKDTFSSSENKLNPFNVYDKKVNVTEFPYFLQKTSNIIFGNYLGTYLTFTTGNTISKEEMLINFPSGYICGINLYEKKIIPYIALWWGDNKNKFVSFDDYSKNKADNDDANNYQYTCTDSANNKLSTFATYNSSTLTSKQKGIINSKYPGKPDSYYACIQGCPGTCNKGVGGINETKLWNKGDNSTYQKSLIETYNYELIPNTIYRCYVEFDSSIPGETTILISLKNLTNGEDIYIRKDYTLKNVNISGYSTNDKNIAIGQQVPWENDEFQCKCNNFNGKITDVKISRRKENLNSEQVKKLMSTGESEINSEFTKEETLDFDIKVGATNNTYAEIEINDNMLVSKIVFEYKSGGITCSSGSNLSRFGCSTEMIAIILTRHNDKEILPSKKVKGYSRYDVDGAHWYKINNITNTSNKLIWDLKSPIELSSGLYKIWYCEDLSNYTLGDNSGSVSYKMKVTGSKQVKKSACEILNKIANQPKIAPNCTKVPNGFSESGQIKCCKDGQMPQLDYFINKNTAGKFKEGAHETISTDTWEQCKIKCKENDNCLAYQHYSINKECLLKTSWVEGSDNLNYFRPTNDVSCGGDCTKWNSGIKSIHKSTCEGNNKPKCSLYGNPKLSNCDKCSDLYIKGVGLICEGCGPITAMLGERNLLKENIPEYGTMADRGFSIIILDSMFESIGCAQFDTHGDPNASGLMVSWLNEKTFSNNKTKYIIFIVWDEAVHRLKSSDRAEINQKYGVLGNDVKLEYRSPYAALVKMNDKSSEVLSEEVHPKYTVPAVINIKCFIPDNLPRKIFSNYFEDKADTIENSRRGIKKVRALNEIHIITKVTTPKEFSKWNDILLYGSDECCGGLFVGLSDGKLFLGNQCNEPYSNPPVFGPKLETDTNYKLQFYYNKISKLCKIYIDSDVVFEKKDVEFDIPGGLLTLGTGCHNKDHENWGFGQIINCQDYKLYGDRCYGKPGLTKDLVKNEELTIVNNSYLNLVRNNLIQEFDITKDYKLDITIHPTGVISGWSNVIHSTLSGNNCCGSKDRLPGLWFFSNTTRLHIRTSTMQVGNDGYDPNIELPLNKDTRVVIIVKGDELKIEYSGGVTFSHTDKISKDRYYGRAKFYASDPWYNSSIAKIKNVKWTNLTGENSETCGVGNCKSVYEKCKKEGGHVATKEDLEIWKSNGGNPIVKYGITTTKKSNNERESISSHQQSGYKGNQNKTVSGRTCQNWRCSENGTCTHTGGSLNTIISNKNNTSWNDQYGIGNHNYCRNPDGEPQGIWCYTNEKSKRWEYCDPLSNNEDHWLDGYGWHSDGCCDNDDRYYMCVKSGAEVSDISCRYDDIACMRDRERRNLMGNFDAPATPLWKSGEILYITIYDKFYDKNKTQEQIPTMPPEPDDTNMQNFLKDVKCEDLCDIGIQGNKENSWLCRTSRPLSDMRCCKVNEGQWCPNTSSLANPEVGTIAMESSGSNRCCCGEVSVEEDIVQTGSSKEDRIMSMDTEFKSLHKENRSYSKVSSKEVTYYDTDGNPIDNLQSNTTSNTVKNLSGYTYRGDDVKCINWSEGNLNKMSSDTIDKCKVLCDESNDCGGFYFNPSFKTCWLENGNCENVKSNNIHYKKKNNFVLLETTESSNIVNKEPDQSNLKSDSSTEVAIVPTSDEIVIIPRKKKNPKPKPIKEDSGSGIGVFLILILILLAIYFTKR